MFDDEPAGKRSNQPVVDRVLRKSERMRAINKNENHSNYLPSQNSSQIGSDNTNKSAML